MKLAQKMFASILTLLAVGLVHAADTKAVNRVIAIQDIETDDPSGYATWVATTNAVAKAKLGLDTYIHVYVSTFDGEKVNSVRAVTVADSVAALTKSGAALQNDPDLAETRNHLRAMRKLGARVLYQGIRFDGTYKNGTVYTTIANVSDEAAYLKALDGLRALYDAHGLQDVKINAYRVLAGRTNHTHRVTLAVASADRLAALLDFVASNPQMAEWLASAAKYRAVVANGASNEITK
jgi:hypothetical protein